MSDYQQGKIYKLYVEGLEEFCYVGSTTSTLERRFYMHQHQAINKNQVKTASCIMFENDNNVLISLIEEYPCNSKQELEERERYWLEQFPDAININTPTRTAKERWYMNHQHNLTVARAYKQEHKAEIAAARAAARQANLEEARAKDKAQREANKEKINAKKKEKVACPVCQKVMNKNSLWDHKKRVHTS